MKAFECDHCGNLVFFENVSCLKCGHSLGFLPGVMELSALEAAPGETWRALTPLAHGQVYRKCPNAHYQVCNWLVPSEFTGFCRACRLNRTIPDLGVPDHLSKWSKLELAKHHVVYTLLRFGLPLDAAPEENRHALQFDFLADPGGGKAVVMGHQEGLITMNIAEADDAERERRRLNLHEPYRTLLGHVRHEVGHYFWDRLIGGTPRLRRFRELFGDETKDYATALKTYYAQGAPSNWQGRSVSAYATAHPWEDWAETWAHYLHIIDTMETAASFGMTLRPRHPAAQTMTFDPKGVVGPRTEFKHIVENWFPLTYALNSLNRGMGLHDLYPFVLSEAVCEKLRFIHEVVRESGVQTDQSGQATM